MTLKIVGLTEEQKEQITKHVIKQCRKRKTLNTLARHLEEDDTEVREWTTNLLENSIKLLSKSRKENVLFLELKPDEFVDDIIIRLKERLCID